MFLYHGIVRSGRLVSFLAEEGGILHRLLLLFLLAARFGQKEKCALVPQLRILMEHPRREIRRVDDPLAGGVWRLLEAVKGFNLQRTGKFDRLMPSSS
jgi:hypothetical protein